MTYKCCICKKDYKKYGWYKKHMTRESKMFALFLFIRFYVIPAIETNDKRTLRVIKKISESGALKAWLESDEIG
jgi:hypothetical protein